MTLFSDVEDLRKKYLEGINTTILARNKRIKKATLAKRIADGWKGGYPVAGADTGSAKSMWIMEHWAEQLPGSLGALGTAQRSGSTFETLIISFLNSGFAVLAEHGLADAERMNATRIGTGEKYDQYSHLSDINSALRKNDDLRALFGGNYGVRPDILVGRNRLASAEGGGRGKTSVARYSPFFSDAKFAVNERIEKRKTLPEAPTLRAIVSCKFTLRSDRAQNVRPEANAAIRLRKGRVPAIIAVTAEPTVSRLESLALGTGEIDCVYHAALPELEKAFDQAGETKGGERLDELIRTRRLRDISDLLFDVML